MDKFTFGGKIVWEPTQDYIEPRQDYIEPSNLKKFMNLHGIGSFDELMKKSTSDIVWFTEAVLKFLDINFQKPYLKVVDLSHGIQFPRWCVDGGLNISPLVRRRWIEYSLQLRR
jgi:acetyl-CoA synthetase